MCTGTASEQAVQMRTDTILGTFARLMATLTFAENLFSAFDICFRDRVSGKHA